MTIRREYSKYETMKYDLLSYLPGRRGVRYQRKRRWSRWREVDASFRDAQEATAGKIALDLGANVGEFACRLAETASKVYAFEPDPWTAEVLRKNVSSLGNVEVIEAGAGSAAGHFPIYRHKDFLENPEALSECSTLMASHSEVNDLVVAAEVEVIDIVDFISNLEADIGIVKMDIEGAELDVLPALFDSEIIQRIGYIYCETHEVNFPKKRAEFVSLRQRAASFVKPSLNLDWH